MEGGSASGEDREVVFMVRDKRFIVLRSKLQVQPPACTVWHELDTKWVCSVGFWVQAHPESFLAKLADNEDDGVMEEKAHTIRLNRDPTLFAHVLKLWTSRWRL